MRLVFNSVSAMLNALGAELICVDKTGCLIVTLPGQDGHSLIAPSSTGIGFVMIALPSQGNGDIDVLDVGL